MMRLPFATGALACVAAGVIAHIDGAEPIAELCGDVAFAFLLLALIVWQRDKERSAGED